jgi:hypothetical protein
LGWDAQGEREEERGVAACVGGVVRDAEAREEEDQREGEAEDGLHEERAARGVGDGV